MAQVNVTVAAATEFAENVNSEILTLTFTNAAAFTPANSTDYYYTVTLTEASNVTEYVFKEAGAGTEIPANTPRAFTVDNTTTQFTNSAVISLQAIYFTATAP